MQIQLNSDSPEKTRQIGITLGDALLDKPAVLLMDGDLGSGKTALSKAIVEGMGISDLVTSPTFTLMNIYGEGRIYHFDLYRLQDEEELTEIGFEDILDEGAPIIIEWPELVKDYPFEHFIAVSITYGELPDQRVITLETADSVLLEGLKSFERR